MWAGAVTEVFQRDRVRFKAKVLRILEIPAGLCPQECQQEMLFGTKPGHFLKCFYCKNVFYFFPVKILL